MQYYRTPERDALLLCSPNEEVRTETHRNSIWAWICARDLAFLLGDPRFAEFPCVLHLRMRISLRAAKILWRAGFGHDADGSPLLAPDGRMVFAPNQRRKAGGFGISPGNVLKKLGMGTVFAAVATPHEVGRTAYAMAADGHSSTFQQQRDAIDQQRRTALLDAIGDVSTRERAPKEGGQGWFGWPQKRHENAAAESTRANTHAPPHQQTGERAYQQPQSRSPAEDEHKGQQSVWKTLYAQYNRPLHKQLTDNVHTLSGAALGVLKDKGWPGVTASVSRGLAVTSGYLASRAESAAEDAKMPVNVEFEREGVEGPRMGFRQLRPMQIARQDFESIMSAGGVNLKLTKNNAEALLTLQPSGNGWMTTFKGYADAVMVKLKQVAKGVSFYEAAMAQTWTEGLGTFGMNCVVAASYAYEATYGNGMQYVNASFVLDGSTTQSCVMSMLHGYFGVHLLGDPSFVNTQGQRFQLTSDSVEFLHPNDAKACSNTRMQQQMRNLTNTTNHNTEVEVALDFARKRYGSLEEALLGVLNDIEAIQQETKRHVAELHKEFPRCADLIENAFHQDGSTWSIKQEFLRSCVQELTVGNEGRVWSAEKAARVEEKMGVIFALSVKKYDLQSTLRVTGLNRLYQTSNALFRERRLKLINQTAFLVCQVVKAKEHNQLVAHKWPELKGSIEDLLQTNTAHLLTPQDNRDAANVINIFATVFADVHAPADMERAVNAAIEKSGIRDDGVKEAVRKGLVEGKQAVKSQTQCPDPETIAQTMDSFGSWLQKNLLTAPVGKIGLVMTVATMLLGSSASSLVRGARMRTAEAEKNIQITLSNAQQHLKNVQLLVDLFAHDVNSFAQRSATYEQENEAGIQHMINVLDAGQRKGDKWTLEVQQRSFHALWAATFEHLRAAATHMLTVRECVIRTTCAVLAALDKVDITVRQFMKAQEQVSRFDKLVVALEGMTALAGVGLHVAESGFSGQEMGVQFREQGVRFFDEFRHKVNQGVQNLKTLSTELNAWEEEILTKIQSANSQILMEVLHSGTNILPASGAASSTSLFTKLNRWWHKHNAFTPGAVPETEFQRTASQLSQHLEVTRESIIKTIKHAIDTSLDNERRWFQQALTLQHEVQTKANAWWNKNWHIWSVSGHLAQTDGSFNLANKNLGSLLDKLVEARKQQKDGGEDGAYVAEQTLAAGIECATFKQASKERA